jgi:hypothetical protein
VPPVGTTSWGPIQIAPGDYNVRIQAIGYPTGPPYAYAQTTTTSPHRGSGGQPRHLARTRRSDRQRDQLAIHQLEDTRINRFISSSGAVGHVIGEQ